MIFACFKLYINSTAHYVSFGFWLLFLNDVIERFISIECCYLFLLLCSVLLYDCWWILRLFPMLGCYSSAVLKILECVFVCTHVLIMVGVEFLRVELVYCRVYTYWTVVSTSLVHENSQFFKSSLTIDIASLLKLYKFLIF